MSKFLHIISNVFLYLQLHWIVTVKQFFAFNTLYLFLYETMCQLKKIFAFVNNYQSWRTLLNSLFVKQSRILSSKLTQCFINNRNYFYGYYLLRLTVFSMIIRSGLYDCSLSSSYGLKSINCELHSVWSNAASLTLYIVLLPWKKTF